MCQRYDAAALTPENNFAAAVDAGSLKLIEAPPEGIDVSLTVIRPVRGVITLVHVAGNHEAERWDLVIPASGQTLARCFIGAPAATSSCRAAIQVPPHSPGGYYYLEANGNTVLEAGLSFRLCERTPVEGSATPQSSDQSAEGNGS